MSTLNGIGTRYLGWQHREDGTAKVTVWFTILFMPIFPLHTCVARIVNDPDKEPTLSGKQVLAGVSPHKELHDEYEVLESGGVDWSAAAKTYLWAWLIYPLVIIGPVVVAYAVVLSFRPRFKDTEWEIWALSVPAFLWLGYALAFLATLFHRSRGGRK
jgi:hypothetical protein